VRDRLLEPSAEWGALGKSPRFTADDHRLRSCVYFFLPFVALSHSPSPSFIHVVCRANELRALATTVCARSLTTAIPTIPGLAIAYSISEPYFVNWGTRRMSVGSTIASGVVGSRIRSWSTPIPSRCYTPAPADHERHRPTSAPPDSRIGSLGSRYAPHQLFRE